MSRPQALTEWENMFESSGRTFDRISKLLGSCDLLLVDLAASPMEDTAKSELIADLEALRAVLGNMSGFFVALQHCIASAPAKAQFCFGNKAYRFNVEGIYTLFETVSCYLHDLSHQICNLEYYVKSDRRIPPKKDIERKCSEFKWYVLRANELINWAADVPVSVEDLISESRTPARFPNDKVTLSAVNEIGVVCGQFKLALKAVLTALGEGSSRNPSWIPNLVIVADVTNAMSTRQLQISITIGDQVDSSEICDVINGTFKPNTYGPFFYLYAACRMLRDSGASVSAARMAPQLVIVIPFPEVA
jgi:hypothetical protein